MSLSSFEETSGHGVLLDEEAFMEAARKMSVLADRMDILRGTIKDSLEELHKGFQTPAGNKFFQACCSTLLQPLDDQKRVINHVSENLRTAQRSYQSVFWEFRELNDQIESVR